VQEPRLSERYCIAWRSGEKGKALSWWLKHLDSSDLLAHLIEGSYGETMQQPSRAKIKGRRIS
jgi:hypothetical protein